MNLINQVKNYYSKKIEEFGANPAGVDWNSHESHFLRFTELTKIIPTEEKEYSILDYGCGYGALIDFLQTELKHRPSKYFGYDISESMINEGQKKYTSNSNIFFSSSEELKKTKADYTIGNGIFNVKLDQNESDWKNHVVRSLHEMNDSCTKGFSFNILTKYSDKEFMKDYLYYADPLFFFDYCKMHFSKYVSLVHDYPLYEFSILVKKQ